MEWVETRAKSVAEAVELALDQLGVDASELDYEVLEEPKPGLFGRVRGEALIRARVQPTQRSTEKKGRPSKTASSTPASAAKAVKTPRGSKSSTQDPTTTVATTKRRAPSSVAQAALDAAAAEVTAPVESGHTSRNGRGSSPRGPRPERRPFTPSDEVVDLDAVALSGIRFIEGLLEAADLQATVTSRLIDAQTLELVVVGESLGVLVGPKGQTLLAFQELVRTYVHHDTGGRSGRLMLDIAGYRQKRRIALEAFTRQVVESVLDAGERRAMEPMNAVDRKVVHDTANSIEGIQSISEGEDPFRYVVLLPA